MLVGSSPRDPQWLVEIKLTKLLTVVTDGTSLHPFDRHKPNQLLLMTDLNSYNVLPCPAGSTLFIFMLSFSTNKKNIRFQKFSLNLQVYFSTGVSSSLVNTLDAGFAVLKLSLSFDLGNVPWRPGSANNCCYTQLGTIFTFLSRDCNTE